MRSMEGRRAAGGRLINDISICLSYNIELLLYCL